MSSEQFGKFKECWLEVYKEQYSVADLKQKREIKNNIYKNINLTEDQKDKIWMLIVEV